MLGLGQLGSSCPVNWKQSSFVDLGLLISNNDYQAHIDDDDDDHNNNNNNSMLHQVIQWNVNR